jgi:hypothetical protein
MVIRGNLTCILMKIGGNPDIEQHFIAADERHARNRSANTGCANQE